MKQSTQIKKENVKLNEINLNKFSNQLSNIDLKVKKEKETLYIYPETFSKEDIGGIKGKQFRTKLRRQLESISNNILYYAKGNQIELIKNEISKFDLLYKANYKLNDYSISSLTHSKEREKGIELMLLIVKEIKSI